MCGGGGGDPGAAAREQEAERKARIKAAEETINGIFNKGDRPAEYKKHRDVVYDLNKREVDRQAAEAERINLISMAQSGIDTGAAAQTALSGLQANANQASGAKIGATVGNLFNDMSQAYLFNQQNQGRQSGMQQGQQWYGVSSPSQRYQGS